MTTLSENALKIAQSRYFMDGEDWQQCTTRVARGIASLEVNNKKQIEDKFGEMIYNMDFLPGGRILRNTGRPKGSLFNCYHMGIGDSIEEIGDFIKRALILWSEGGGVGCNFTPLRPKGDAVLGKGGKSSGLVSFVEAADAIARTIESGGARRAAAIAHVDISHPEVIDFIDAKLVDGRLSSFNISVTVTEDFLSAVETDDNWTFKFKQKEYETVRAKDIWHRIVDNMIRCAEPGLINWDNFSSNNSYFFAPVRGTNPCHTGDTLVAVADGRGDISFKQLADEGKDVPVFSRNPITGNVEVKMMRNPRKTMSNAKIYKVYLEGGMTFRCNGEHKVIMYNGEEKQVKDLKPNDRLHHMIKYQNKLKNVIASTNNDSDYIWINNGFQKNFAEHRLIAEFKIGRKLKENEVVHHIDYMYNNNNPDNLQVMTKKEHDRLHSKDMFGQNNPMRRFPEKNYFSKHKFCDIENGNSKGYTLNEITSIAVDFVNKLGRRPMLTEWVTYCKKYNLPYWSASMFKKYGGHKEFFDEVCSKAGVPILENQYFARSYKKFLEVKNETDLDVFWDHGIKVNRQCEICGRSFVTDWGGRERCFCSVKCVARYANTVYHKASTGLNFKVTKVEEDGYEDLYNGTVDDNHNYYVRVGTSTSSDSRKHKINYILSKNCGETTLASSEACDLGSLVLPNFISTKNTNWKKLESTIYSAVRFLDNVIDVNKYSLKDVDIKVHQGRRIGLGVIGLAEYLFAKGLRYGSPKAIAEVERLMRFIRDSVYHASVELAAEKGSFPAFDPIPYCKAHFIRTLPAPLRMDIKKFGIRNCTLMALAPTGTISLLAEYTSSVEPLFAKAYYRKDRVGKRMYIHPLYKRLILSGQQIPEWFVDTFDLKPSDHFDIQVACQKYTDGAVSKTINLPKGTTVSELSGLLLEYLRDLKGVTVYTDGSRSGQILNRLTEEEVRNYLKKEEQTNYNYSVETQRCSTGKCEL